MSLLIVAISVIAGAILSVLVDWLIKLWLPEKPETKHRVAAFVAIFVLVFVVAKSLTSESNKPTAMAISPTTSVNPTQGIVTDKTIPAATPTTSVTLEPIQGYTLPLTEVSDIVYDGTSLWALFGNKLAKLEPVEDENRFRAIEQIEFPAIRSLDWDVARGQYWAISAMCDLPYNGVCQEEIELIDQEGNITATLISPQTFDGLPTQLAWDGEYLWLASQNGNLYKLQAALGPKTLKLVDSFGLSLQWGKDHLVGLAWDGTALWLLDGYILTKLESNAQPICRITLPATIYISWWEYLGITWDGQYLWVINTGTNNIYRVDPALCE